MNLKDLFKDAKGSVHMRIYDKATGLTVDEIVENNLILKTGRQMIVQLICNDSNAFINTLAIGKGGAKDENNISTPIEPKVDDTGLTTKVSSVTIASHKTDLTAARPSVTFNANLDSANVNSPINEFGLVANDGTTMFAKKTFKTIPFDIDSNLAMEVNWTIVF